MLFNLIPANILAPAAAIFTPCLCALLLRLFSGRLPKDHGREFAVDGEKSAGKIRGAGIVFVISFIICGLVFIPVSLEYGLYYALIFLGMLSGYLDDRSEKPWGEYKKGAIDLLISAGTAAAFVYFNRELTDISLFGLKLHIPTVVFGVICAVLVWMLINAVNCTDGIDGFSSTLACVSFVSLAAVIIMRGGDKSAASMVAIMALSLIPYLWKNAEPSTMMMGDAGSRALGLLMAILVMKTGNILLVVPLCLVICLDGLMGIAKVSIRRFLRIRNFMEGIRTPLHDHARKNKGWSNTQVIYRFCMLQILVSLVTLLLMR
ncbi:MAG: phospho-N-acetylmuramoyl-pentapeptide-transferase [Clostridia bacterium]|nr:phospho-N-acetylmuramoyl-pentapeptide-transferase [Clostridia bacterium]